MDRPLRYALAATLGATSLTSAALVASGTPVAAAESTCRPSVTVLPDLGFGGGATAFYGDVVVGRVIQRDGLNAAAYWRDGKLHVIGRRFHVSTTGDINSSGDIVGNADRGTVGWIRHADGSWSFLPNPRSGGDFSITSRRLNEAGQVAGSVGVDPTSAARWDRPTQDPVLLQPAPGDDASFAKGINNVGRVAGDSDVYDPVLDDMMSRAATWSPTGRIRVLPGLYDNLVATGWTPGAAIFEINDVGVSAGESIARRHDDLAAVQDQATLWRADGTPVGLGFLPGTRYSGALGLSSTGEVSGASSADFDGTDHAFVWSQATGMLALPVPGAPSYAAGRSLAHEIEGDTVVGQSAPNATTPERPTVWRCPFEQAFLPSPRFQAPTRAHRDAAPVARVYQPGGVFRWPSSHG